MEPLIGGSNRTIHWFSLSRTSQRYRILVRILGHGILYIILGYRLASFEIVRRSHREPLMGESNRTIHWFSFKFRSLNQSGDQNIMLTLFYNRKKKIKKSM